MRRAPRRPDSVRTGKERFHGRKEWGKFIRLHRRRDCRPPARGGTIAAVRPFETGFLHACGTAGDLQRHRRGLDAGNHAGTVDRAFAVCGGGGDDSRCGVFRGGRRVGARGGRPAVPGEHRPHGEAELRLVPSAALPGDGAGGVFLSLASHLRNGGLEGEGGDECRASMSA